MFWVYVLKSQKNGKKYVGFSSLEPQGRLAEHNNGKVNWTRSHRPVQLLYCERFEDKELAHKRELFFKTGKGRRVLDSLLKQPLRASGAIGSARTS